MLVQRDLVINGGVDARLVLILLMCRQLRVSPQRGVIGGMLQGRMLLIRRHLLVGGDRMIHRCLAGRMLLQMLLDSRMRVRQSMPGLGRAQRRSHPQDNQAEDGASGLPYQGGSWGE